jgi:hypothetical protein
MTTPTTPDQLAVHDLYQLAISARDMEINQLVQRNNFFMIFQGVLLAGLLQASGNGKIIPIVSFLVCCAGLLLSLLQVGMAAGAKFWQERWEDAVEKFEEVLLSQVANNGNRTQLYKVFAAGDENINELVRKRMESKGKVTMVLTGHLVNLRFSPSKLPIYAGYSFVIVWALLIISQIDGCFSIPSWIVGFKPVG